MIGDFMNVVFTKGSLVVQSVRNVAKVTIHPKAEDGRGVIHVYERLTGATAAMVLLDDIDSIVMGDEATITPEQEAMTPKARVYNEKGELQP
jgi:hypothetical protein